MDPGELGPGALPLAGDLGLPIEPAFQGRSVSVWTWGQSSPVASAGCRTPVIVPRPTLRLPATARRLSPRAHFWRAISAAAWIVAHLPSRPFRRGGGRRAGPPSVARSGARPGGGRVACSRSPIYVFTLLILAFTMTDPGVHVGVILAFTFDRSWCSPCAEIRNCTSWTSREATGWSMAGSTGWPDRRRRRGGRLDQCSSASDDGSSSSRRDIDYLRRRVALVSG